MKVMGGQMNFTLMTAKLLKEDEKKYLANKAGIWLHMLQDLMKPTKWLKPTKNGTKVNFDKINTQEEYDRAYGEFEGYVNYLNKQYGLDLGIEVSDK